MNRTSPPSPEGGSSNTGCQRNEHDREQDTCSPSESAKDATLHRGNDKWPVKHLHAHNKHNDGTTRNEANTHERAQSEAGQTSGVHRMHGLLPKGVDYAPVSPRGRGSSKTLPAQHAVPPRPWCQLGLARLVP